MSSDHVGTLSQDLDYGTLNDSPCRCTAEVGELVTNGMLMTTLEDLCYSIVNTEKCIKIVKECFLVRLLHLTD